MAADYFIKRPFLTRIYSFIKTFIIPQILYTALNNSYSSSSYHFIFLTIQEEKASIMSFPYVNTVTITDINLLPSRRCQTGRPAPQASRRVTSQANKHTTFSVMSALVNHYFQIYNGWVNTCENIIISNYKPDFCIEGLSLFQLLAHFSSLIKFRCIPK